MTTAPENRRTRPPRSWQAQTAALMVVIAGSALLGMVLLASDLAIQAYLRSGGESGMSPLVRFVIDHRKHIDTLNLMLLLVYFGSFIWWRRNTREMLRRIGDTSGTATRHWAVMAWNWSIFAALIIRIPAQSLGTTTRGEIISALGWHAAATGLRLVALTFLTIGVWQIREQVLRAVAGSGVTPEIGNLAPGPTGIPVQARPSAFPVRPLPPVITAGQPVDLPPADDEFWDRASRLATGLRSDIAVLETVDPLTRRWALLPETGDVDTVRASVPGGAVVTVFPDPPAASSTRHYAPIAADEYYGFLENMETGALWFQSVTPKRVNAFLARARSARRWALYPADSPTALSAVMPLTPVPARPVPAPPVPAPPASAPPASAPPAIGH